MTKRNIAAMLCIWLRVASSTAQSNDWQGVEDVLGRKGTVQSDVLKIAFPRSDLHVSIGQTTVAPALALTSWIAFKSDRAGTMIMGDLVLLEPEIAPVMNKLVASGIGISALHNHIVNETPKVMYMHFSGHGNAIRLAEVVKAALALTQTPISVPAASLQEPTPDWSTIESVLGVSGQRKGNVLQIGIPRAEMITENGMTIPPFMGMASAMNFQQVGNDVATTGDFVLLATEVDEVVKTLTSNDIAVTAIHNHMLFETPRLFFLHFWGFGEPQRIAHGLKDALGKIHHTKKG